MNDEKLDSLDQALPDTDPHHPSLEENGSQEDPSNRDNLAISDEKEFRLDPECVPKDPASDSTLLENPLQNPDPAATVNSESASQIGLEQLRGELTRLRAELAEREVFWERLGAECDEFRTLYPNVSLGELPDRVWEDVRHGIPIAAAFALAEKRRALTEALAEKNNRENQKRSAGSLTGTENDYFSPAEVRAMSSHEVHENYQKIMRSIQKWR